MRCGRWCRVGSCAANASPDRIDVVAEYPEPAVALASAVPQTQTSMLTAFDISPWLVCLWIAGSVFALALLIGQQRRFVRGLGRLSVLSTHIVRAESKAGCPALVGAWRPQVVLPADFEHVTARPNVS